MTVSLKSGIAVCVFAASLLATQRAASQNLPQISISPWTELAPGIRCTTASASSPNWQIRLIQADLGNRNVDLEMLVRDPGPATLQKTSVMAAATTGVIAAVNAGYFSGGSGGSVSHVREDGVEIAQNIGSRPPRATFGLTHNKNAQLRINRLDSLGDPTTPADTTWDSILDAIGGGPNLITAGAFDITTATEGFDAASGVQPDTRQPRTALGYNSTSKTVTLMTVDGRQSAWSVGMTMWELAYFLDDLGCDYAMNYDGGGSTTAWIQGSIVNRPSDSGNVERAVFSAWGVVPRYVIDDTDGSPDITMTPSAWGLSANAGFYNTGSRVRSSAASGSIVFTPNLARAGLYHVEAWWVADPNRASNATFQITHSNGTAAVTRDQTADGSQWNHLGTFVLPSGTGASVSLSTSGANGFISADAVRFTYAGPDPVPVGLRSFITE